MGWKAKVNTKEKSERKCKQSFVVYFKVLFLQLSEDFGGGEAMSVTVTFLSLLDEIRRGGLRKRQQDF